MTDQIADLLARLKNAIMRKRASTLVTNTKMNKSILEILKTESFIANYTETEEGIVVDFRYVSGTPVVENFIRVSKPGQRMYVTKKEILPVLNGRGISIVSTSEGLMVGAQAKSKGLGGEFICKVW